MPLKVFLTKRLTAAAVEISAAVGQTIAAYQDEISRSKGENERLHRMLDLVFKPYVKVHTAGL